MRYAESRARAPKRLGEPPPDERAPLTSPTEDDILELGIEELERRLNPDGLKTLIAPKKTAGWGC